MGRLLGSSLPYPTGPRPPIHRPAPRRRHRPRPPSGGTRDKGATHLDELGGGSGIIGPELGLPVLLPRALPARPKPHSQVLPIDGELLDPRPLRPQHSAGTHHAAGKRAVPREAQGGVDGDPLAWSARLPGWPGSSERAPRTHVAEEHHTTGRCEARL